MIEKHLHIMLLIAPMPMVLQVWIIGVTLQSIIMIVLKRLKACFQTGDSFFAVVMFGFLLALKAIGRRSGRFLRDSRDIKGQEP